MTPQRFARSAILASPWHSVLLTLRIPATREDFRGTWPAHGRRADTPMPMAGDGGDKAFNTEDSEGHGAARFAPAVAPHEAPWRSVVLQVLRAKCCYVITCQRDARPDGFGCGHSAALCYQRPNVLTCGDSVPSWPAPALIPGAGHDGERRRAIGSPAACTIRPTEAPGSASCLVSGRVRRGE